MFRWFLKTHLAFCMRISKGFKHFGTTTRRQTRYSLPHSINVKASSLWHRWCRLSASLAFSTSAFAQNPIVIKFSHVVAADTPKAKQPSASKNSLKKTPKAASKSSCIRTARYTKTKKNSKRCNSARCKCSHHHWRNLGHSVLKNLRSSICPFPESRCFASCDRKSVGAGLMAKLESKGITGFSLWDNGFKVMSSMLQ